MAEGTVFFADEPILRVAAPLPVAQLVESRLINLLHFQTVIASKAARMVMAGPDKTLIDFGLRRAHGAEAGLLAARACHIAGFAGSATMLANRVFGVPVFGTMAHSFIQAHDEEAEAFLSFARARPQNVVLLIDTYDSEKGAEKVVALAPELATEGTGDGIQPQSETPRFLRRTRYSGETGCRHPLGLAGMSESAYLCSSPKTWPPNIPRPKNLGVQVSILSRRA
jgi:putative nicotinate phosphoribosyltransferase